MALTAEQLKNRTQCLGGSDIAAALGLSRYMTPLQLWAIKTGQIEPEDISKKLQVRLGNKLEQTVAELFEEETGKKLHRVNEELIHPNYSFLRGHIDRRVVGERAIVEIKTTGPFRTKEFDGDEVPTEYLIQTLYYMAITRAEKGYIACLFGNSDFRIKEVTRNPELERDIIGRAVNFWTKFVQPKVMPTQITKDDGPTLYNLFPEGDESQEVDLGEDANLILDNLIALGKDAENVIGQMDKLKNDLKVLMKDKAIAKTDRYAVTWKQVAKKEYVVPASKTRVLRYREIAKEKP